MEFGFLKDIGAQIHELDGMRRDGYKFGRKEMAQEIQAVVHKGMDEGMECAAIVRLIATMVLKELEPADARLNVKSA